MVRRVYFAFHYRDVASFRANVVRNSWVTKPDREEAGFFDASLWEETKKKGDDAIKKMIDRGLDGASVTVVLIGVEASSRKWVKYEIKESHKRGNGLLGVYIHNIEDKDGSTDEKGDNPFDNFYIERDGKKINLSQIYPTYDWERESQACIADREVRGKGSWLIW